MLCLNCGAEMMNNEVLTKHGQISYNACEHCGSLWLDAGELDKMAFRVEGSIENCSEDNDDTPETQPKKCPRCDDFDLDRVRFLKYSDIILHHCRNCGGFWLDGGELNLINKELRKIMPVHGRGFSDFVNNVHVPYWYKQIKRRSDEVDFPVEALPIKGAHDEGSTTDACPNCGSTLKAYEVFSMKFEGCPKCKGIWLVKDELRKLKNKAEHGLLRWMNDEIAGIEKTSARLTDRLCVQCKTVRMVSVLFGKSSIVIDWCPRCHGMWLDRGEFESIIEYLKNEESGMRPREIEKEALQEVKQIWSGGPETRLEELRDARAAVSALINATIFEHPKLFYFLQGFQYI
jgi:Zn-finger nucleic acid-binding protein